MLRKFCLVVTLLALPSLSLAGPLVGPGQDSFDREVGTVADGSRQLNYEFFRPPDYSTAGNLPLVIYLHGYSDGQPSQQSRINETMNGLVMATQTSGAQAAFLLVPKIPILDDGWSNYLDMVRDLIDDVGSRYQTDSSRYYLIGYSDGGYNTPVMIAQNPGLFAAGVPISGGGPTDPGTIDALKNVPLWFFHGNNDNTVPPSESRNIVNALIAAGGNPKLTIVTPGNHNAGWMFAFTDANHQFYPWLFSQALPVPEPSIVTVLLMAVAPLVGMRAR